MKVWQLCGAEVKPIPLVTFLDLPGDMQLKNGGAAVHVRITSGSQTYQPTEKCSKISHNDCIFPLLFSNWLTLFSVSLEHL